MKDIFRRVLAVILVLFLVAGVTACGNTTGTKAGITGDMTMFIIDGNGYVTWSPIPQAVQYECAMVDRSYTNAGTVYLTEPGFQLEAGYSLHMRPVFADGSTGDWHISDYYGEGSMDQLAGEDGFVDPAKYVDMDYSVTWDQLDCFDVIGAIRWDTVRTDEDGMLYFEADGPHGTMRFEAEGVAAEGGALTFQPGATLWGLDAIGRICAVAPRTSDPGDPENWFRFSGGYTFSQETSVETHEDLMYVWGQIIQTSVAADSNYTSTEMMDWQANFIIFGSDGGSIDAFTLSALEIYYDTAAFTTGIRYMALDPNFYGLYLTGDRYDSAREVYDLEENILTFYLTAVPDLRDELIRYEPGPDPDNIARSIIGFAPGQFETGALRHADGTEADRNVPLEPGMTLDVTVGDCTYPVALPVSDPFRGAQTLSQLVPYAYPEATGEMNAILIPVTWRDQTENANDDTLFALKGEVGRVLENGTVTDYSEYITEGPRFSLSRYFDTASYGKLQLSTFVTDWFIAPFDYSEYKTAPIDDEAFREAVYTWLMDTYPDMDWTSYDRDGNGYFDAIMVVNVGTSDDNVYYPGTFAGGAYFLTTYNGSRAGTPDKPCINGFINVNASLLGNDTLIHEFGHVLGLIDYYDVTHSGIDAVGHYDMQSANVGDWNPYSKYAAGWTDPIIVDLAPGETAEYTIGAFCDSGDSIVIPVHRDTFDGPFNEYIMLDLFTDGGVNAHDAASYRLENVSGVRIYHIDSRMEVHVEEADSISYTIGTPNKVNAYSPSGIYHVELIQAGKNNTFTDLTDLRTTMTGDDLFRAGSSFTVEDYSEFFKDGKMDDGSEFPYIIEILSVSSEEALIRITARN